MKSRIAICALSAIIAVLSLSFGGCSDGGYENAGNNPQSDSKLFVGNSSNDYSMPENFLSTAEKASKETGAQTDSVLESAPNTPETPSALLGEPTIFIGLDGIPIYTSDIKRIENTEKAPSEVTAADEGAEVFCDGFQYFKKPVGTAFNNYSDPELFDEFDFLGEMPANNNKFERVNVGEEICGLKLVNAASKFAVYDGDEKDGTYYTKDYSDEANAEFEGSITLEGFLYISARNSYEPDGGSLHFTPTEDVLPVIGNHNISETDFGISLCYNVPKLRCVNEVGIINIEPTTCYMDGLGLGDAAYVRATLGSIKYYGSYISAELEGIEVLSDVLVHIEDQF